MTTRTRAAYAAGIVASGIVLALSLQHRVDVHLTSLEAVAVVTYGWSTWLLARNMSSGWWVGLVGCAVYAFIFYRVRLFADFGIQVFCYVTSVQAIVIWLRGGAGHTAKPVGYAGMRWLAAAIVVGLVATLGLRSVLIGWQDAAPFWDAMTTVFSLIAQVLLMARYVESWYLWIVVDAIYVPLYITRGLYLTSILNLVFLALAVQGLRTFQQAMQEARASATSLATN